MGTDYMNEGVHVRSLLSELPNVPGQAALIVQIFPIESNTALDLSLFVRDAVNSFLTKREIVSGNMTEIPLVAPDSKIN